MKELNGWLEDQIQDRFPDNLNITVGQMRIRIFRFCLEYADKLIAEDVCILNEPQSKDEEFWSDPCWTERP